jgi:hypothetical protein
MIPPARSLRACELKRVAFVEHELALACLRPPLSFQCRRGRRKYQEAVMARVEERQALAASAEEVWRLIGGYHALSDWHPAVERSVPEEGGRLRRLALRGGGGLLERLHAFSERERSYAYSIEEGPLPVASYRSTLGVRERGGQRGGEVYWSGDFAPAGASESEAEAVIRGIYRAGLDTLAQRFGAAS